VSTRASDQIGSTAASAEVNALVRAFRWTRMMLHVFQGLLMTSLIYPRVKPSIRAALTQMWSAKLLRILNVTLDVHGAVPAENTRKLFIVSNHVSWLDIFALNAARPSRFVAKSEIRDWPIAGWLCEFSGTIFVQRTKRSDTARTNAEIHDALEQGDTVAVFPEGTTTAGDRLLKFHTSLFEPVVANSATLAPAAIRYRLTNGEKAQAVIFIGDTTFTESMGAIIRQPKMIAEIIFAPQIDTHALTRRDAAAAAEDAIAVILNVPKPHAHQRFGDGATALAAEVLV
jgi:1-acyl-sn-glycerol-3-phosphate acyltransferase